MKQREIEIGVEYAYKRHTWREDAIKVRVLEKSLPYGDARGQGIRVLFIDQDSEQVLLASKLAMTWEQHELEKQRKKMALAMREAHIQAMESRVEPLRAKLAALGFGESVTVSRGARSVRLFIRFSDEDDVDQFMEVLDNAKSYLDSALYAPILEEMSGEQEADEW